MIKGKSINIRNVREKDLDDFYRLSFDYEDAGAFMPISLTSERAFKKEFTMTGFWQEQCGKLIIEDKSGKIIGEIGSFNTAHYMDGREIYYRVFSGHTGRGYASEALKLFIKFFFQSTSMNRLQAVTIIGNEVSEHMLKKSQFTYEGTLRQARYFKGRIVDLKIFSLIRSDWQTWV